MSWKIVQGDCRTVLRGVPENSIHCCVTSPPYWGLRDYGVKGQLGLERTPDEYVENLVDVFRAVRRVLRDDGTLWLNLGDSYATGGGRVGKAPGGGKQGENWRLRGLMTPPNRMPIQGLKPKDLVGIPWRVAFALQRDGWYLRSDIIWHKPACTPESVRDRPTRTHEYIFLLSKAEQYFYDQKAILEPCVSLDPSHPSYRPNSFRIGIEGRKVYRSKNFHSQRIYRREGRNKRSVWTITTKPFKGAHFAVMPPDLVEPCILAGSPRGGLVLDPFAGAGTVGLVCARLGRSFLGIELNPKYRRMAERRIDDDALLLNRRMSA